MYYCQWPLRAIFSCLGIEDIVAKNLGSSNTKGMIAAKFNALANLYTPGAIASRRDKNISNISTSFAKKD